MPCPQGLGGLYFSQNMSLLDALLSTEPNNINGLLVLSVIIIHYATVEPLMQTLAALAAPGTERTAEIIVVDNATLGRLAQPLQELYPTVHFILNQKNSGFSKAANLGGMAAKGEFLLFLNGDCFLTREQIREIEQTARRWKQAGALGFRQVTPTGLPQLTFGQFPTFFSELQRHRWQKALDQRQAPWAVRKFESLGKAPFEVDWVSGSCLLVARETFLKIGGFDEDFFLFFEDIDLCRRIQDQGLKIYHFPEPAVLHLHGASASRNPGLAERAYRQSQLLLAEKHKGWLERLLIQLYVSARRCCTRRDFS